LPHIFTDDEVTQILDATSALNPIGSSRPDTYRTLFGLLAATGVRIGEARRLKMRDVAEGSLFIHKTKFKKSRWLPVHPTTAAALDAYRSRWRAVAEPSDPFFVTTKCTTLPRNCVFETFDEIVRTVGLRKTEPASRPRPHPGVGRGGVAGRGCSVAGLVGAARPPGLGPCGSMSPFACRAGLVSQSAMAHGSLQVESDVC
jgi:integrase